VRRLSCRPIPPRDKALRATTDARAVSDDKGHGRLERRTLEATTRLNGYLDWPGVGCVLKITRDITRSGERTVEVAFAISSLTLEKLDAPGFLNAIRAHWGIENRLHWSRDMNFDEDRCRVRSGSGPQALAAARNTVQFLLRLAGETSVAAGLRRFAMFPSRAVRLVTGG
jgi:predicted transposase YbfD/YdcC